MTITAIAPTARLMLVLLVSLAMLTIAAPVQAEWHEASSDHFVIYADDSADDVRKFATELESYHAAMAYVTGRSVPAPSPSNRVTIFVVGSQRDIRRLAGEGGRNIAGFYTPRAGGSRAFVQDIKSKSGYPHFSTVVLLHEYAHHFLISSSRFAMPRWMSEGAAEFFAAATFRDDGTVQLGRPAQHRVGDLAVSKTMSMEELLDPVDDEGRPDLHDGFYGRAWALYHYLMFNDDRQGQLGRYAQSVASGKSSLDAGREVFGDLGTLNGELRSYLRQRRMFQLSVRPELISVGEISVRKLPQGEAGMMPIRIRSQRGVNAETAAKVLVDARKVAAKYRGDAGVLTALAEAEYDAGNDQAAIAAADAAIALDPNRPNAYVQKGYALFRIAEATEYSDDTDREAAFTAAMVPFATLNGIENDHPLPLIYYYRSYAQRGAEPIENAKAALERAAQLAPFDQGLWMNVAVMQMGEGKIELAKASLRPIAGSPHGGRPALGAQKILAALDLVDEGTVLDMRTLAASFNQDDSDTGDAGADAPEDRDPDTDTDADNGTPADTDTDQPTGEPDKQSPESTE